jgi:hypothetical protein
MDFIFESFVIFTREQRHFTQNHFKFIEILCVTSQ